jgi:hypothetical protein
MVKSQSLLNIGLSVLILISPLVGMLVLLLFIYFKVTVISNYTQCFFIASIASSLNLLKLNEGDLIAYINYYKDLEDIDLTYFLISYGKEPVFYIISFLIGIFSTFNEEIFKYLISFIIFTFILVGLSNFFKKSEVNNNYIFFILFFIAFNPVLFNNSLHLLRQTLALGFILLMLGTSNNKLKILFIILSIFSHVSSIIVIAPFFSKKYKFLFLVFIIMSLVFLRIYGDFLFKISTNLPIGVFNYFLERVTQKTYHEMPGLGVSQYAYTFFILFLICYDNRTDFRNLMNSKGAIQEVSFLVFYLAIIVLVVSLVFKFNEPGARLFYYFFVLSLIVIVECVVRYFDTKLIVLILLFFPMYIYVLAMNNELVWHYRSIFSKVWLSPVLEI